MRFITDERAAQIRARVAAATPGPWERFVDEWRPTTPLAVHRIGRVDEDIANVYLSRPADADLITNAPADLADLLAERDAWRDVVEAAVAYAALWEAPMPQAIGDVYAIYGAMDAASATLAAAVHARRDGTEA